MKNLDHKIIGAFCLLVIGFSAWLFAEQFRASWWERSSYQLAALPDTVFRRVTPEEKLVLLRAQAAAEAVRFVTNAVTGFRRMIFCSTLTLDPAVSNWTGIAEAEFINRIGGVEKQFVHLRFRSDGDSLFATPDWELEQKQSEAAFLRAMTGQK